MVTNSDDICSNDFQHLHCGASADLAITSEPACGSVCASCGCPGLPHSACLVSLLPMLRYSQARSQLSLSAPPDSRCNTRRHAWYAKLNRVGCFNACCSAYAKVDVWAWASLCFQFTQSSFLALAIVAFGCGF